MPEFIINSSHGRGIRFGKDEANVRNILRGILVRYPNAEVTVYYIAGLNNVTDMFVLGAGE